MGIGWRVVPFWGALFGPSDMRGSCFPQAHGIKDLPSWRTTASECPSGPSALPGLRGDRTLGGGECGGGVSLAQDLPDMQFAMFRKDTCLHHLAPGEGRCSSNSPVSA